MRPALVAVLAACLLAALPSSAHATGYDRRTTVVNTAIAQLGKPYLWGASGPSSFDCSGLVKYCFSAAGMTVPSVYLPNMTRSGDIWSQCDTITADRLEPGDLAFRASLPAGAAGPTSPSQIYHVAIYAGGGRVIEAPSKGKNVSYRDVSSFSYFGRLKSKYWPLSDGSYDQPPLVRGDFNGDGKDDQAYVYGLGGTATRIWVLPSNGTTMGPPASWYSNGHWDWNRTKVVGGDFNRDGKSDVAALYDYGNDTSKLWVFLSTGKGFSASVWWSSAAGRWSWSRTRLVSGDFSGDRRTDVGLLYDDGSNTSHLWVARSSGTAFYAPVSWWASGVGMWDARSTKLAAGDFTGDGKADVVALYDNGRKRSAAYLFKSTGTAFSRAVTPWYTSGNGVWDWARVKLVGADVTGDRKADLLELYDLGNATSKAWTFVSTGSTFLAPRAYWTSATGGWDWERAKLGVGDFDHEGRSDAVMLSDWFSAQSKAWAWESRSDGTSAGCRYVWGSSVGGLDWNRVK